jgi:hypothetical protein
MDSTDSTDVLFIVALSETWITVYLYSLMKHMYHKIFGYNHARASKCS